MRTPIKPAQHTDSVRHYFDVRMGDYDSFYEESSAFRRWFNRTFRKAVYVRRNEVLRLSQRYDCRTILDVGCGSGRNTLWWARQGIESLHGVDFSTAMIEEARAIAQKLDESQRCTFEVADFLKWESERKFDLVAACGVFDYVIDAEALLRHMSRFAKKVVCGSFPGWTLVRSPLRKIRYALRGCPTHFYRRREIEEVFGRVGFGPVEMIRMSSGCFAWSHREPEATLDVANRSLPVVG